MIAALLTSVALAREEETGTLEMLLVSPVRPWEIVLGKVAPYVALAFLDVALVVTVGRALFGVPLRGSLVALAAYSGLYVVAAAGLGLLISTMVRTQQQAMMAAMLATTLPSFMLSGFIFPIASMPAALQAVSHVVPARYFVTVIRGIMLKGLPATAFAAEAAFLAGLGALLVAISIARFHLRSRAAA
jgi:ABC-2 type transport system permease protein